jgi:arylsulfatase A-like enzyme
MKGIVFILLQQFGMALTNLIVAQQGSNHLEHPNVIIINMDDMGYGDIEPYGMTGIPTPNFNRLAKEGMRCTHFNVGQPICTASRAALLTGCYPNRLGMQGVILPWDRRPLTHKKKRLLHF